MKKLAITLAVILFSIICHAQNTDVTRTSQTTITTVKDSDGEKQSIKKKDTQEVQNIELQNADSNSTNKVIKETSVYVTKITQIINPDRSSRTVSVYRSGFCESQGQKFEVTLDANGYTVNSSRKRKPALLRKT